MDAGDCCPMQRAWETLLAQARTNHKAQQNIADLVQAHRDAIQVQRELAQAQREVVQVNRVMTEATLLAMRGAQGCCELPCQDDELQADRQVGKLGRLVAELPVHAFYHRNI